MTRIEEIKELISVLKHSDDWNKATMRLVPDKIEEKLSYLVKMVERMKPFVESVASFRSIRNKNQRPIAIDLLKELEGK